MVQRASPVLYHAFRLIQMNLRGGCTPGSLEHIYEVIPTVNFSSAICEPLAGRLSVLPVPDVGWSDWGTVGSILRTLKNLGRFDDLQGRVEKSRPQPMWHTSKRSRNRAALERPSIGTGSGITKPERLVT